MPLYYNNNISREHKNNFKFTTANQRMTANKSLASVFLVSLRCLKIRTPLVTWNKHSAPPQFDERFECPNGIEPFRIAHIRLHRNHFI